MTVRVVSAAVPESPLVKAAFGERGGRFYARVPRTAQEWTDRVALIRDSLLEQDWVTALAPSMDARGPAAARLERAATAGFAVTAGQQPGLFGGPLYTLWKALSALALADVLEQQTGIPAVPVFWAATDDGDVAEASSTFISTTEGVERLAARDITGTGQRLSDVPLNDVTHEIERLAAAAGSASGSDVLDLVRQCYQQGNTVGNAYVELLRSLLNPLGIVVLDAAHRNVRSAGHPLLLQALEKGNAIHAALELRTREIKSAGHAAQVKIVRGRSLVFTETEGRRDRVRLKDAAETASRSEPGSLGPNVLLRPIMERSILPTVAYLGGPGEVAYFAQVTAAAEALGVPSPVILPRWSGFIIEPRVDRILERYRLSIDDFRDPHAVEARLARESLPEELAGKLLELKRSTSKAGDSLAAAEGSDLVGPAVLQGFGRNLAQRVERLERRFAAGVKKRGTESLRDASIARGSFFPEGVPQERALNAIPFLARYGDEFIAAAMKEIRAHAEALA